jgi:hypothetical protein
MGALMRMRLEGGPVSLSLRWRRTCLLAVVALLLFGAKSGDVARSGSDPPKGPEGSFIARLYGVRPGMSAAFTSHLRDCCLPLWRKLRAESVVSAVSVFELLPDDPAAPVTSPRRFILVAELNPGTRSRDFHDAEEASCCLGPSDSSLYTVLLEERMACTPRSCHGELASSYADAPRGIDYLIEFIAVEESAASLNQYRNLMMDYFGPVNGHLVREGMMHCFIALEATEILSETPGVTRWNQLHISDGWDVAEGVDWDAVYPEVFRSEFGCELDSLWDELPPLREGPAERTGRLVPSLCVR